MIHRTLLQSFRGAAMARSSFSSLLAHVSERKQLRGWVAARTMNESFRQFLMWKIHSLSPFEVLHTIHHRQLRTIAVRKKTESKKTSLKSCQQSWKDGITFPLPEYLCSLNNLLRQYRDESSIQKDTYTGEVHKVMQKKIRIRARERQC